LTIAVEIICTFFLRTKFNDFLIWQVAAKVAAEPSCVHDTIFHPIFHCDMLSAKILWCEHKSRIKKSLQNRLAFYFHRQAGENRIMRTVKEIQSDFNWSINLVKDLHSRFSEHFNVYMFSDKIIFCHLFISYFPHYSVSAFATFQKNI
jgi:hypothetical protein